MNIPHTNLFAPSRTSSCIARLQMQVTMLKFILKSPKKHTFTQGCLPWLLLFNLAACSSSELSTVSDATWSQNKTFGVMGGFSVESADLVSTKVVGLYNLKTNSKCSASIISKQHILTAAHCIQDKTEDYILVFAPNMQAVLKSKDPTLRAQSIRTIESVTIHPFYRSGKLDTPDVAILKMKESLPTGYTPFSILQDPSVLEVGLPVHMAGYGDSKVEKMSVQGTREDLQDLVDIGQVYCEADTEKCFFVDRTGSGVLRAATATIANVSSQFIKIDESQGQGTCSGDSGGPAFIVSQNQYIQIGVTSSGSMLCNKSGFYVNIQTHLPWIQSVLEESGGQESLVAPLPNKE